MKEQSKDKLNDFGITFDAGDLTILDKDETAELLVNLEEGLTIVRESFGKKWLKNKLPELWSVIKVLQDKKIIDTKVY